MVKVKSRNSKSSVFLEFLNDRHGVGFADGVGLETAIDGANRPLSIAHSRFPPVSSGVDDGGQKPVFRKT